MNNSLNLSLEFLSENVLNENITMNSNIYNINPPTKILRKTILRQDPLQSILREYPSQGSFVRIHQTGPLLRHYGFIQKIWAFRPQILLSPHEITIKSLSKSLSYFVQLEIKMDLNLIN